MPIQIDEENVPRSSITKPIREFTIQSPAGTETSFVAQRGINGIVKSILYEMGDIPVGNTYTLNIKDRHGVTRYTTGVIADNHAPILKNLLEAIKDEFALSGLIDIEWVPDASRTFTLGLGKVIIEVGPH